MTLIHKVWAARLAARRQHGEILRRIDEIGEQVRKLESQPAVGDEALREAVAAMVRVARQAVAHVAFANYPDREHEAMCWIDEAAAVLLEVKG